MILRCIITAAFLMLFSAGLCCADTLVITYRSGKTQTVVLDEASSAINSWQFVGGTAAAAPAPSQPTQPKQAAPQEPPKPAALKADPKQAEKPADKKSNVRFMWNAPPLKD